MITAHTLRAGHNSSRTQSNINAGDHLVMSLQLILELKSIASSSIKLNVGVSCHGQRLLVGREGVVGDGVVEEVVNFGSCHFVGV